MPEKFSKNRSASNAKTKSKHVTNNAPNTGTSSKENIIDDINDDEKHPIILVPYRDRKAHLDNFIPAISSYLPDAKIYVIEQADILPFNRGWLLNTGFLETEKIGKYWIMHDIDMIPVKVDYSYPDQPIHLATECSQFGYKMPYPTYFGGVNAFNAAHFKAVNGFVNNLEGWGAEDDILYQSFIKKGYRPGSRACRFNCLPHTREINNNNYAHNLAILKRGRDFNDGLTSCNYKVIENNESNGYNHLKVIPGSRVEKPHIPLPNKNIPPPYKKSYIRR